MLPRVAYVTHAGSAAQDPDLPLALAAFERHGLDGRACAWDGEVDWADFDLVLVRSAWDYYERRQEFLRWARSVEQETVLANPALTLARNTDKTYLRDLAGRGIPTIDTVWFEPGDRASDCRRMLDERGWSRLVVKANIGDGGRDTQLVQSAPEAIALAERLVSCGRVAMIQPYLPDEERAGEVSVIVLGGAISHAVSRIPTLTARGTGQAHGLVQVSDELVDVVERTMAIAASGEHLLYARVDLVPHAGQWLLIELEATEPCLFLNMDPDAPHRLARAVRNAVTQGAWQWDSASG